MSSKWLVAIVAVALLVLSACGGEEAPQASETPEATEVVEFTTCGLERAGGTVTPSAATPTAEPGQPGEYRSAKRGYTVRYPADWTARPDLTATGTSIVDGFFSPELEGQVRPNLTVTCELVPVGMTSEAFTAEKTETIAKITEREPKVTGTAVADGQEASVVEYVFGPTGTPPVTVEKTEVFFVDALGGWSLTLTVPEGRSAFYRPLFDEFVASFQRQ